MNTGWPATPLRPMLGTDLPIIQAPMAGANLSAMAIAVSDAGGLGSLPCAMLTPEQIHHEVAAIRAATTRPFNLNFFCHRPPTIDPVREDAWRARLAPYYAELGVDPERLSPASSRNSFDEDLCSVVEASRPPVVSFHFGLPDAPLVARVKKAGATVLSSATTVEEARWLEAHGCDAIIAQGLEAGGHRGIFLGDDLQTQLGTFALVSQIVDAVSVPVIAAGGIMDGRGIVAALALGASGVQLGTAYLFCPEATIGTAHRAALHEKRLPTMVTNVLTGRPARGLATRFMLEVGPWSPLAPEFPRAATAVAPLRAAAEARGHGDFSPLWAGAAYPLGRPAGAAELTQLLARDTLDRLNAGSAGAIERDGRPPAGPLLNITSGMTAVGLTSRWIAASRATESDRADALFRDPLARALAGDEGFAMRRSMGLAISTGDDRDPHLAIRTRFFDDALLAAVSGQQPPQVLILAAGMDSRAFRLDWPAGAVLFEVDRQEIFDWKEPVLARMASAPRCERRVVPADLAGDWAPLLIKAGLDMNRPTAVLAEGLMMYLDEADARAMLMTLRTLVAPGSWLGMDIINAAMLTSPYTAALVQRLEELGCPWKFGVTDADTFLREHGWTGTLTSPGDADANYSIWPFPPVPRYLPDIPRSVFVRATRSQP